MPIMGVRSVYSPFQPTASSLVVWEGFQVDNGQCSAVKAPNQTCESHQGQHARACARVPINLAGCHCMPAFTWAERKRGLTKKYEHSLLLVLRFTEPLGC